MSSYEDGGGREVVANRDVIGPWETFALLPQPALIMDIESVALHEIGHCLGLLHVNIPGAIMFPSIPANTQKRVLDANDVHCVRLLYQTWVTLRANNGQYLCAEGGGGGEIVANRDEAGPWERFSVYNLGGNSVALVAHSGHYLCAEDGGGRELVADRIAVGPWETFTLHNRGNGNIALQAANGQFVCAEGGGGGEVVANRDAIGSWETFERSQT